VEFARDGRAHADHEFGSLRKAKWFLEQEIDPKLASAGSIQQRDPKFEFEPMLNGSDFSGHRKSIVGRLAFDVSFAGNAEFQRESGIYFGCALTPCKTGSRG